jgi:hypothetical protein
MPKERQWLHAEQSGEDEPAEMIFARLVADMPPIEPSTGFVERTVRAACRAHNRRRLVRRFALIAAALLLTIAGAGSFYELAALATSLILRSTVVFSHALVWFLTSASEGARWWWIPERIGTAISDTIAAPSTAATLAGVEMLVLLVIYAFQRVLGDDAEPNKVR